MQHALALAQQSCGHELQRGILRTGNAHRAAQDACTFDNNYFFRHKSPRFAYSFRIQVDQRLRKAAALATVL